MASLARREFRNDLAPGFPAAGAQADARYRAMTGQRGDTTGFIGSVWWYLRVLGGVLAAVGLLLMIGLQSGWIGLSWSPPRTLGKVLARGNDLAGPAIKVTGAKNLFSKDKVPVDTGSVYRLDADVRVLPKPDGSVQTSLLYFGVSTYDAKGKELTSPPGSYRYAGALGTNISSDQGWVHLSGTITGEGDLRHKQFRPGTKTIRLVMLANYRSADEPILLIRDVAFSRLIDFVP